MQEILALSSLYSGNNWLCFGCYKTFVSSSYLHEVWSVRRQEANLLNFSASSRVFPIEI